jgi:predicted transcriptional regulator
MDEPLSPKEIETYDALVALTEKLGRPPTLVEIGKVLGLAKTGVQRHVISLRRKGAIVGPKVVGNWAVTPLGKKLRRSA